MNRNRQLSVRTKLFVFLCVVSLLPLLLSSRVLVSLGGNSFRTMREFQVQDGLDRALRSFEAAEGRLQEAVSAVAGWEDLAGFFQHPDARWAKENLEGWAPQSYKLDYLALCDATGRPIHEWNPTEYAESHLLAGLFSAPDGQKSGWVSTPRDLYLLASSDVFAAGKHLGVLIFGRKLTHRLLLELQTDKHSDLMVYYGGRLLATTDTSSSLPLIDPAEIFSELVSRRGTYLYEAVDQNRVIGFRGLKNLQGTEIAAVGWFCTQSPASIVKESVKKILLFFGIPLLALVLLAALILGLWIERPIRTLSKTMEEVRQTGDLSRRVPVSGGGEISSMSNSFNQMLEQLSKQRDELLTFQTMILAMKEGVLIEDADHQVIYMNPRMEEMLGIKSETTIGEGKHLQIESIITAKGQRIEDEMGFFTEEVEWIRPDGRRVQALKTSGRLEDPHGKVAGVLSTFVDITERNDLEIELIDASRMAFLGLYSQGIIHNLNGPLNSILGFSSLICRNQPDAEVPQRIHTDAQRMAEQISILGRRWHRTGTNLEEPLNLNEIIVDEAKFLEADLFYKHNVQKDFDLDPDLPCIQGVYGDFSHALLNVIINSIEALSESPVHKLMVQTRHSDGEIRVEIEDTGVGIPPENLNKIFLPFFSTKRRDRKDGIPSGAGLGLAITRKILEPYGVRFEVESDPGRGTRMILHIPLLRDNAEHASERQTTEAEA